MKIVREVDSISLGYAKDLVDASTVWSDRFSDNDSLREKAIEELESDV